MCGLERIAAISSSERSAVLLAIFASAILGGVLPLSIGTPLLDPDEGIHATIALEMLERRDFLHPTFLDQPFRDKPAFYSAFQAVSLWAFGRSEFAIRLPGLIFQFATALTTWMLAKRLFGKDVGLIAPLVYLSLGTPIVLALAPAHDIAQLPFLNLLLLYIWSADHESRRGRRRLS